MEKINYNNLTEELVKELLNSLKYLDSKKRGNLLEIAKIYINGNIEFLYKINQTLYIKGNKCEDENNKIYYYKKGDKHYLEIDKRVMEFSINEIKEIIHYFIDILQKPHPLGTVVELKKEYLSKMLNNQEIDKAIVVIVNRFIFYNEAKTYFNYSEVVYPIGFAGTSNAINFTDGLIHKVIQEGYSDEKEDAYIYLMKKELIVDKGMRSFPFANEESREKFGELAKEEV